MMADASTVELYVCAPKEWRPEERGVDLDYVDWPPTDKDPRRGADPPKAEGAED